MNDIKMSIKTLVHDQHPFCYFCPGTCKPCGHQLSMSSWSHHGADTCGASTDLLPFTFTSVEWIGWSRDSLGLPQNTWLQSWVELYQQPVGQCLAGWVEAVHWEQLLVPSISPQSRQKTQLYTAGLQVDKHQASHWALELPINVRNMNSLSPFKWVSAGSAGFNVSDPAQIFHTIRSWQRCVNF